jgi:hypothetical protein
MFCNGLIIIPKVFITHFPFLGNAKGLGMQSDKHGPVL